MNNRFIIDPAASYLQGDCAQTNKDFESSWPALFFWYSRSNL
jgi:hypothetical protein